jgi:hypothetical protein
MFAHAQFKDTRVIGSKQAGCFEARQQLSSRIES